MTMTEEATAEVNTNGAPPAERRALTVAQIRQAPPDCREEWVEVPEWGGWIKLCSPTALGSAEIKSAGLKIDTEGQTVGMDIPAMERAQMKHGVADPPLTDDDVTMMQEKFGPSWNRVMVVLDRLTGPLGKAGMKESELLKETENTFREG